MAITIQVEDPAALAAFINSHGGEVATSGAIDGTATVGGDGIVIEPE